MHNLQMVLKEGQTARATRRGNGGPGGAYAGTGKHATAEKYKHTGVYIVAKFIVTAERDVGSRKQSPIPVVVGLTLKTDQVRVLYGAETINQIIVCFNIDSRYA